MSTSTVPYASSASPAPSRANTSSSCVQRPAATSNVFSPSFTPPALNSRSRTVEVNVPGFANPTLLR